MIMTPPNTNLSTHLATRVDRLGSNYPCSLQLEKDVWWRGTMPSNNSLQNIFISGGDCLQIKTSADCYAGQTKSSHMNPTLKLGECCRGGSGVGLIIFMMINIRAVMIMYNAWQQLPRVEFNAGVRAWFWCSLLNRSLFYFHMEILCYNVVADVINWSFEMEIFMVTTTAEHWDNDGLLPSNRFPRGTN